MVTGGEQVVRSASKVSPGDRDVLPQSCLVLHQESWLLDLSLSSVL